MSTTRAYELFWHKGKPTCQSVVYGRDSNKITQVVAVSLAQAMLLAANGKWLDGGIGIAAERKGDGWHWHDGTIHTGPPYKHYQEMHIRQPIDTQEEAARMRQFLKAIPEKKCMRTSKLRKVLADWDEETFFQTAKRAMDLPYGVLCWSRRIAPKEEPIPYEWSRC